VSIIMDSHGTVIHRSRNLAGLRAYARKSEVVAVTVQDTDKVDILARMAEHGRTGEDNPRRYSFVVQYRNGAVGRDYFADWRIAADFIANRRSWRTHLPLGSIYRRALEVISDIPGFMERYESAIVPRVRLPESAKGQLPIADYVMEVTRRRPPTPSEIRFGHGATHYRDFPVEAVCWEGTRIPKRWFVADDGLRYYR